MSFLCFLQKIVPSQRLLGHVQTQVRTVSMIPAWEYHLQHDGYVGRKRPCRDVLDRFKRLHNGLWIRGQAGRGVRRWAMSKYKQEFTLHHVMCSKWESRMLDKLVTPYWLRPHYYVDDPYKPYHVRHGLDEARVSDRGKLLRERRKILLEDSVANEHF